MVEKFCDHTPTHKILQPQKYLVIGNLPVVMNIIFDLL